LIDPSQQGGYKRPRGFLERYTYGGPIPTSNAPTITPLPYTPPPTPTVPPDLWGEVFKTYDFDPTIQNWLRQNVPIRLHQGLPRVGGTIPTGLYVEGEGYGPHGVIDLTYPNPDLPITLAHEATHVIDFQRPVNIPSGWEQYYEPAIASNPRMPSWIWDTIQQYPPEAQPEEAYAYLSQAYPDIESMPYYSVLGKFYPYRGGEPIVAPTTTPGPTVDISRIDVNERFIPTLVPTATPTPTPTIIPLHLPLYWKWR